MDPESIPVWIEKEILHIGAEAKVTLGSWLGNKVVLKKREPKEYRHPSLERRLTRQRLTTEARILTRLQLIGFPSPSLLNVNLEEGWMILSHIDGRVLYDALLDKSAGIKEIQNFGKLIRKLHEAGFSHGDLTTHNVMLSKDGTLSLIDFGLARIAPEIEHLGLDLQVLNECLTASHYMIEKSLDAMIQGYLSGNKGVEPNAKDVIERFNAIRGRVRYHA